MDSKTDVQLQAQALTSGETMRGTCPECGKSDKFYITRFDDGNLAYVCHRARNCGTRGYVSENGPVVRDPISVQVNPYRGALRSPGVGDYARLASRFPALGIHETRPSVSLLRMTGHDDFALSIKGPASEHRGIVIRQPWWATTLTRSKALTYRETDRGELLAWYRTNHLLDGLVIVEDQMSAMCIAATTRCDAVALLGTEFNVARARELQKHGHGRVMLALDADVPEKAFKIAQTYGSAFSSFQVILLDADPKDMTVNDLRDTFR